MSALLKDALAEIGHPAVTDRSSPSWDYEAFCLRYPHIHLNASELVSDAAKLEHLLSAPEQKHLDLACAYLIVLDQWRRCRNALKVMAPKIEVEVQEQSK